MWTVEISLDLEETIAHRRAPWSRSELTQDLVAVRTQYCATMQAKQLNILHFTAVKTKPNQTNPMGLVHHTWLHKGESWVCFGLLTTICSTVLWLISVILFVGAENPSEVLFVEQTIQSVPSTVYVCLIVSFGIIVNQWLWKISQIFRSIYLTSH